MTLTDRIDALAGAVSAEARAAVAEAAALAEPAFSAILAGSLDAVSAGLDLCLVSCASARWVGGEPEEGIPGAAAAHILDAATASHLTLPGFMLDLPVESVWSECGEASAILAGDALVPAAMGYLASKGGLNANRLVGAAASLLCGSILPGFSSELSLRDRRKTELQERENAWRRHAGGLARFAAEAGAVLAGADAQAVDGAALAGLELGRAVDLARMPGCPSRHGSPLAERVADARAALSSLADSLAGDSRADLFIDLIGRIRSSLEGADLFAQG